MCFRTFGILESYYSAYYLDYVKPQWGLGQDSIVKCISISAPNVCTMWDKDDKELQVSSGQVVLPNEFFYNLQFSELS